MMFGFIYIGVGFRVVRFDKLGNARAFKQWSEQRHRLHVFCVPICQRKTTLLTRQIITNNNINPLKVQHYGHARIY